MKLGRITALILIMSKHTLKWEVILTLFVHNNGTTPKHIRVGPNVWTPLQYALVLCHYCAL
jgi:hypothetical protein